MLELGKWKLIVLISGNLATLYNIKYQYIIIYT